jgi:hypothetical protein
MDEALERNPLIAKNLLKNAISVYRIFPRLKIIREGVCL